MYQEGEWALQACCVGFDSLGVHHFIGSNMSVNLSGTNPPVTLEAKSNNLISDMVFIDGRVTASGQDIPGKLDVNINSSGQWDQLLDILQYCGRTDITTAATAQLWYKAQTPVSFVNTIRAYLLEVFFPKLVVFINSICNSTGTAPPVTSLNTMIEGWDHILKNMQVTYENGLVKSISI
jgi:hypothetical protein